MSWLLVTLQYLLPRHLLTALLWRIAGIRHIATKNFLIRKFVAAYDVNTDEVRGDVPDDFATFNDFFIRELDDGERPIADGDDIIVSPVDGTVSIAAPIIDDQLIQAKGLYYSLDDLLATDLHAAQSYVDGIFATIYLAPYNYHRVHAPLAGELVAARYVPGDLFSVNTATASRVPRLFVRNERLVMHFRTAQGPAALIMVGALNVGSISTPWSGTIRPRRNGIVESLPLSTHPTSVAAGSLLGWFNMGSTVILLLPPGVCEWDDELAPGELLRVGEAMGRLSVANE